MKKLTVVGRGTVGCLTVAHFLRWTNWNIDWIFDSSIEPAAVGEGTTLSFPASLKNSVDFDSVDMENVYSTPKLGIWKRNWGKGKEFKHTFHAGNTGIHFNAVLLQKYLFEKLSQNNRIRLFDQNSGDYENLDSDYVIVCTGTPNFDEDYIIRDSIPVNACRVYQSPWDYPKFNFSLTFAKKFGWTFGIPLTNRCAVGYLYNDSFTTADEVHEDVQDILNEFGLVPQVTRDIKFRNYSRKVNFTEKVCYNGNASFFLEPLEATSTGFADQINRHAFDLWHEKKNTPEELNDDYHAELDDIESMICMHYFSGSVYDNAFWQYAKSIGTKNVVNAIRKKENFYLILEEVLDKFDSIERRKIAQTEVTYIEENNSHVGSWTVNSFYQNIKNLEIRDELTRMMKENV